MDQYKIFTAATKAAEVMADLTPLEQRAVIKLLNENKDDLKITAWDAAKIAFFLICCFVLLLAFIILPEYYFGGYGALFSAFGVVFLAIFSVVYDNKTDTKPKKINEKINGYWLYHHE